MTDFDFQMLFIVTVRTPLRIAFTENDINLFELLWSCLNISLASIVYNNVQLYIFRRFVCWKNNQVCLFHTYFLFPIDNDQYKEKNTHSAYLQMRSIIIYTLLRSTSISDQNLEINYNDARTSIYFSQYTLSPGIRVGTLLSAHSH